MIPLILAATIAIPPVVIERQTFLGQQAANCQLPRSAPTADGAAPTRTRKLGDLPDANAIRAVIRKVDGCQYQDVIRYQVSKAGPTYPSGTLAPVQDSLTRAQPTGGL